MKKYFSDLEKQISCPILTDSTTLTLYSTDASVYREEPLGVVIPSKENDIQTIIRYAFEHNINIIARSAGTSLAGQVVGKGLVIDCSVHFNHILSVDKEEKSVWVEAGVVRDKLNNYLKPYRLFFAPETSTSNRCCIAGMIGNNSCGLHSIAWGTMRENIIELECLLSDGSKIRIKKLTKDELLEKLSLQTLEGDIYRHIYNTFSNEKNQDLIKLSFPYKKVIRRNNGYALDTIMDMDALNLCSLIAGSEGTLCYILKAKLKLKDLPSNHRAVICIHFHELKESFYANLICLKHHPIAVELMDDNIINAARRNTEQKENLFFVKGKPKAIIVDELLADSEEDLDKEIISTVEELKNAHLGYAYVVVKDDIQRVWALRKAGLGLLTNVPGDMKPVSVIEDTAVAAEDLPNYMEEFAKILKTHNLSCVYHAHIASGELHLRPILNLKNKEDLALFKTISHEVALLVKKYHGSLSGEHGDGRLRGEYIPLMYGRDIYNMMREVKRVFDPHNILNKGKIIDTPPIDSNMRYDCYKIAPKENKMPFYFRKTLDYENISTYYSFEKEKGLICAIEQCNGAGVCRKDIEFGGVMCPSFRAGNLQERFSTRARANILRETLCYSKGENPFASKEVKALMDECLMCKGCKKECPSNVDMSKLKGEFLQHYYDAKHIPFNILMMSYLPIIEKFGSFMPNAYNFFIERFLPTSSMIKNVMSFSQKRHLPTLNRHTLRYIYRHRYENKQQKFFEKGNYIYLLADEFTNFQDSNIGEAAIKLFNALGYGVKLSKVKNAGRILLSKGLLKRAKHLAEKNIHIVSSEISKEHPLVGIEPSAILSFRDEYKDLVTTNYTLNDDEILLFDEFLTNEINKGRITKADFTDKPCKIAYHTHCQQKAISGEQYMQTILSFPDNYSATAIPSGCCGMAGSFGYEKKHYSTSEKIADEILIPAIKALDKDIIVCASGTSCREQIAHFAQRKALHPIEILLSAVNNAL